MVKLTNWGKLPTVASDGSLLPFLSPKQRELQAWAIYQNSGGDARMVAILQTDADKFYDFGKDLHLKRLQKPDTNIGVSDGVEALLEKLDAADRATLIDSTATEVTDAA